MDKYEDIMDADRPVSQRHPAMAAGERAAQFSPFSALTGYDAVIAETARLTQSSVELDEGSISAINAALVRLSDRLSEAPVATITYFCPDQQKSGGAYLKITGKVKKIDLHEAYIQLTDGTQIPLAHLRDIDDGNAE